ncbi:hypothetical protein [Fodinibius salsisoli]|uniref:Uncharacterized protein n=1 Tax=Fodinibius salsisoli TaxID=2820877 RepID=A0ABT3PJB5_9BACT|nr:hypothetical protein [Fodinibius salsisoli]MCW9705868.1 hypothetical protein [Fodinibius salsisoli]
MATVTEYPLWDGQENETISRRTFNLLLDDASTYYLKHHQAVKRIWLKPISKPEAAKLS